LESKIGGLGVATVGKYMLALAIQMGLITGIFTGLVKVVPKYKLKIPVAVDCIMFCALAFLKSRAFNPNRRPKPQTKESKDALQRKIPSWTPPNVIFPKAWLLLIEPLRATISAMVYRSTTGCYANTTISSLILHLFIGSPARVSEILL
jgi:hypothetical protein